MNDINQDQSLINIFEVASILKSNFKIIVACVVIGIALGLYLSFASPNVFRSQVIMVEAEALGTESNAGGLIGSILGSTGLSPMLGGFTSSVNSKIAVLESRKFTEDFVVENNLLPKLFPNKWDAQNNRWIDAAPTLWDANFLFAKTIRTIENDLRRGLIILKIDTNEPELSAEIANKMVKSLNEFIRKESIKEANETIEYLKLELDATNIIDIKKSLNGLLQDQLKTVMIASTKEEYAFKVIDPAYVNNKKIKPFRALIMVVATALSGIFGMIIIFVNIMFQNQRKAFQGQ